MIGLKPFKIDFAIAGTQKAGTTALAQYLGRHPDLFLPVSKETHYFRRSLGPDGPTDRPISHLTRHYVTAPPGALLGDATPVYMYWPHCLQLLRLHNPELMLIVSLRHPVERAWSAWSMEYRRGRETLPFSEAIREGRTRVSEAPKGVHLIYSYVERGFYARQIENLLKVFDRDQVFFLRNDQINATHEAMQKLQIFLDVDPVTFAALETNVHPSSLPPGPGLAADYAYLQSLYQNDIFRTAELSGLDLNDWYEVPALPERAASS